MFGSVSKETPHPRPVRNANSWTQSAAYTNAIKRLLEAQRSMAPGGWSDDRYEQSRHFTGTVYTAVGCLMRQMGQAEFQVFHKDPSHPDGKRPADGDHKLVQLLEKPNKQDSFGQWMTRCEQQIDLTGTALTWMVPNVLGTPMELYCIPTAIAVPQPAINVDFPDGFYRIQPLYPYGPFSSYPTPNSAVGAPVPAQWMMRFLLPHPLLRYEGYSPLTGMRLEIDQLEQMNRSRWYSMKRSINPSAVLNFDEVEGLAAGLPPEEVDRIHAEWEQFQGTENHGKMIVGFPGSKLEQFGTTPKDMDYPAGWDQMMNFVLGGGFGITKPAAGMVEDSSYSNLYATLKQLHLLTLQPRCDMFASDITRTLAPFFGDDLIVEIRCRRIDDHDITFAKVDKVNSMKGLPVSVIKYNMRMMELPINEEMVQELSKSGQEQQMPGGMPGAPGGAPGAAPGAEQPMDPNNPDPAALQEQGESILAGMGDEQDPMEATRDKPGGLGAGALGPRMKILTSLNGNGKHKKKSLSLTKSFYDCVRESLNGNGKH